MKKFFSQIIFLGILAVIISCQQAKVEKPSFEGFIQNLTNKSSKEMQTLVETYLLQAGITPIIENRKNVHFFWYGTADSVKIQGDLQRGWSTPETLTKINCGDFNFFYISYILPSDAQIEYQFIVNDEIALDLRNPKVEENFGYGDRNVFTMPDFKPSPYLDYHKEVRKGNIETKVFKSRNIEFADRNLEVYLPAGYSKENTYPVLLVNDGKIKLYTTPFKNIIDNLIHEQIIEPVIVVFVPYMERQKEYCFQDIAYSKVIAEEMVPFISENYSTKKEANHWGIMGSSMGGNISMVTGFLYSEIIANVGAQGGAGGGVSICNAHVSLKSYLKRKEKYPLENIFASVGTYDLEFPDRGVHLLNSARKFHHKLDSLEIEHVYKEYNDGHRDSNWNNSIDDILILFFGK